MLKYIKDIMNNEMVQEVKQDKCEKLYAFFLSKTSDLIGDYDISGFIQFGEGDNHHIFANTISLTALKETYVKVKADAVVLLHNHPKSLIPAKLAPSDEDIDWTFMVGSFCNSHKIQLVDHLVVDHKNYYSFVENDLMDI